MSLAGRLSAALPDTLFARITLVLVGNLALVWAVAAVLVQIENRLEVLAIPSLADRIAAATQMLNAVGADRPGVEAVVGSSGFDVSTISGEEASRLVVATETDPDLVKAIEDRMRARLSPDAEHPEVWSFVERGAVPRNKLSTRTIRIAIGLNDGEVATFRVRITNRFLRQIPTLALAIAVCITVSLTSLLFARAFSRQLAGFARAAEAVGRSIDAPPLREMGPREIRLAARALNQMQERLRRFVRDRTQMLAAISHDLRTPLTRLRLRAEFLEDGDLRRRMLIDIAEMEAMIRETLAFARDDGARERRTRDRLDRLLEEMCRVMHDGGAEIECRVPGPVEFEYSPVAMRRALGNLADNAVKYGKSARIVLDLGPGQATITIDDDGPGIPEEQQERVFQPFQRLDASRNRDTGGVGLGLSVARTIIRGHGGDVTVANRPGGGLRATVTLPV
jgi:signal transduction histidine kinase